MSKHKDYYCLNELPWPPSAQWKLGEWYPLSVGFLERDNDEYIINGYDIFERESDDDSGDIKPVFTGLNAMSFTNALELCEKHNGRKMI